MKAIFVLLGLLTSLNLYASTVEYRAEYCQPAQADELKIFMEDMGWWQSLEVMSEKFNNIYKAGKRLDHRAYLTAEGFVLPLKNEASVVNVGDQFIKSVVSHIETALERNHADYIFFSDMGHSHMLVDLETYNNEVSPLDNQDIKSKYEIMLNHPGTKFLYHTAEQLKMKGEDKVILDDRKLQWRFFTRNIVGDNLVSNKLEVVHAHDHEFNTAGARHYDKNQEKYRYWGAGYSISASKNGCFAYKNKGETFYFDISLYDVNYSESSGGY